MNPPLHKSASACHYDQEAKYFDLMNEENASTMNRTLEGVLTKHKVKTVLDVTCGTGSQVFWLSRKGFEVTGVDINLKMLKIAQEKAKNKCLKPLFIKGDIRTKNNLGTFDSVISIFNSIGHLTRKDFKKALQNIRFNLKKSGLYVFDIFNLNYLLKDDNVTCLTIDWLKNEGDTIAREIQYSTISVEGILTSYDIYHEQKANKKPKIAQTAQTLQVYGKAQLKAILEDCGFKMVKVSGIDGSRFYETKTQRMLIVAKKQ